ncbi:MAG: hypothetical protein M3178_09140 [Pseudomonadota bacterium]|nr:hypothetical protein [Pseudomonadota bacterium]
MFAIVALPNGGSLFGSLEWGWSDWLGLSRPAFLSSPLTDDRKFPYEGSGFLQRKTELVGGFGFTIEKGRQHEVKCRQAKVAREGAPAIGKPRAVTRRKAFC